jgi:choline monooxygenase
MGIQAVKSKGFVSRFNADPLVSYTLPAKWYYDAGVYEQEREKIFFRTWQFMCFVGEVAEPGSFKRNRIFDQEILITRDHQRKLHAFYNVCPHRGSIVAPEEKGCQRTLVCMYHGWTFDMDGRLKSAGNAENVAGFNYAEFGLPEVRVEELAGMIFVNLDPNAQSLREMAGDIEQDFRDAVPGFDQLTVWRRDPFTLKANWKIAIENFVECYHCPYAHPRFMGGPDTLCSYTFESEERRWWSRHIMRSGRPKNVAYDFSPDDPIQDGFIWMLWPNTLFMTWPAGPNFFVFHVIPDGPEQTRETFDLMCIGEPGPTELAMFQYHSEVVNGEDVGVVEGVQKAIHARGYQEGRLMVDKQHSWRSEGGVHHFNKLVWDSLHE